MKKSISLFLLLITLVLSLTALISCTEESYSAEHSDEHEDHSDHDHSTMELPHIDPVTLNGRKLQLVASTSIVGDVLNSVVGDSADVAVLMPPGQNPHSWSPAPRDIAGLEKADLIFVNGLDLEVELVEILKSINDAVVIPVSAGLDILEADDGHNHTAGDPHTWFSPVNVMHWVVNIEHALSEADPGNHKVYEEGADSYQHALQNLDSEIRSMVDKIPPDRRKLVIDHSSISYFARDYGFSISGNIITAVNDQAEPSARQINELISFVQSEDIRAIFVSNTAGRSLLNLTEAVAAESGRDIPVVTILTGSLASEGERGSDYLDFILYNTEQIVGNLQ